MLLDLHLLDKSGLVVLRELNTQQYPAPIFVISGDSDLTYAVEAVKSGAFDHLLKPFDARAIVEHVGNAITCFARRSAPHQ